MTEVKPLEAIGDLIIKITTNGKQELDRELFKELIVLSGQCEENLKYCHEKLMEQLKIAHAEVRFSAFLLISEIFRRSQLYRNLLVEDLNDFIELTIGSNSRAKLPPPKDVAELLKSRVIQTIKKWYEQYGEDYNKIVLVYNYLRNKLKVNFEDADKRCEQEVRNAQKAQERKERVLNFKLNGLKMEMDEHSDEISRILVEMDNCFNLVIPKPNELFENDCFNPSEGTNDEEMESGDFNPREHGFLTAEHTITIDLNQITEDGKSKVERNEDNEPLIDNLRDLYILAKRFYTKVKKWAIVASSTNDQDITKKVLNIKEMMRREIVKYEELRFGKKRPESSDPEETDDSDFEEVEEGKDGFEEGVVAPPVPSSYQTTPNKQQYTVPSTSQKSVEIDASSSSFALLWNRANKEIKQAIDCDISVEEQPSTSSRITAETRKEKLLKIAPKVPFGVDLMHWGSEDKIQPPTIEISDNGQHRFWQPLDREGDQVPIPGGAESLRTRVIEFTGLFEPVKKSCRVPLPNGSLCPRKDRIKCPFHGKIIPRDEKGEPTDPEDKLREEQMKEKERMEKPPDWQDPEHLKELKEKIGIDLTIHPKGQKKGGFKKKKSFAELYPNLTSIEKKSTPRSRLEKKIFKKGSLKRVGQVEDSITYNKHQDKYADQFNYAMNS